MRVVVTSDFHSRVPADDIEPCDLLILAGDCLGDLGRLGDWLGRQPADQIVGIAGNADLLADEMESAVRDLPWTFLHDEATTITDTGREVVVYGSPWSVAFGDRNWGKSDAELAERWAAIPDDTEILVTHGPAWNIGDWVGEAKSPVGSVTLRKRLAGLSRLRLHAFGCVHDGYGVTSHARFYDGGAIEWWLAVNGSYVDGDYRPGKQPPLAVTI